MVEDPWLSEETIVGLGALASSQLRRFSQVTFYLNDDGEAVLALPAEVRLNIPLMRHLKYLPEGEVRDLLESKGFSHKEVADYLQQRMERKLNNAGDL